MTANRTYTVRVTYAERKYKGARFTETYSFAREKYDQERPHPEPLWVQAQLKANADHRQLASQYQVKGWESVVEEAV
jgi:hypothetical protein